jgi:endonuclease YncB( thermonuclease family)
LTSTAARTALTVLVVAALVTPVARSSSTAIYRIDHITDGDTVVLRNGQRVRLVQIDNPEVFFGTLARASSRSRAKSWASVSPTNSCGDNRKAPSLWLFQ